MANTVYAGMAQFSMLLNCVKLRMNWEFPRLVLTAQESPSKAAKMALSQTEMEQLVNRAVSLYNRLKSPEVTVKAVLVTPVSLTISFSGGFCYGCGIMDYVDGFAAQFKALSGKVELKVAKTREINPRVFEADYTIKIKV